MSDLLHSLVSIYSPSEQERPAVEHLTNWMRDNSFDDAHIDDAGNAVGIKGQGDKLLVLLGHIDTFPGDIPVRVEDAILYGRGSVDAKGSLCTFAEAAAQASIPAGWQVMVVGAVEEEAATSKGAVHVRSHVTPDMCIIGEPSGAARITLGYKGRVIAEYKLTRPESHSARPEPTTGALGAALWQDILNWSDEVNEGHDRYFDQVMPGLRSINTSTDGFHETVEMVVGFRLPPHVPPAEVEKTIRGFAEPDADLQFRGAEHAYLSDKNTPLVRGMLAAIRAHGERPAFVVKTGTSDMNVVGTKWECPIIAYGPGDSNLDHTPNEHIPLAEYQQAVVTLKTFLESLT